MSAGGLVAVAVAVAVLLVVGIRRLRLWRARRRWIAQIKARVSLIQRETE